MHKDNTTVLKQSPAVRMVCFVLASLFLLVLWGCRYQADNSAMKPSPTTAATALLNTATPSLEPSSTPSAIATEPTATAVPEENTAAPISTTPTVVVSNTAAGSFPPAATPYPLFAQLPVTTAEQQTAATLEQQTIIERDDIFLAADYLGLATLPDMEYIPVTEPLPVGTTQTFVILNIATNTRSTVSAELKAVSDHAYFWFDETEGNHVPTQEQLDEATAAFDEIYEEVIFFFGSEDNPGIDGDPRVYIFNASPLTICSVTVETATQCGLLGYFSRHDTLPFFVSPQSNEHEMFVMNGSRFGSPGYLEVLAHEFRHMIEANHDRSEADWEVEGSAMLAEDLLGYSGDAYDRANLFINSPDQQLNRWSDDNTIPRYGQGYALNRYIYERLGTDLYRDFATSDEPGLQAVTAVAFANQLGFSGLELWRDWLIALAIHNRPQTAEIYQLPEQFHVVNPERITAYPAQIETTVYQYAADYFTFSGTGSTTVTFTGSSHVPLLEVQPASGAYMWLANRANYSQTRLTRTVDLTAVASATLQYDVYYDIEAGYDFAYVAVSADDGYTWQPLQTTSMQSKAAGDDPGGAALTDYFYSGQSRGWLTETADLSPYAGQTILLRFEYVTDPILTYDGLVIDNILIPEIGFADDAESDTGWTAEGFVRATAAIPQTWHLQLITFDNALPIVQEVALDKQQTTTFELTLETSAADSPILIIAATAPMTLQPAYYRLEITQP